MIYDSVGWAKVAATFEGRRLSGQKMERGNPLLIHSISKISIKFNYLKCQICQPQHIYVTTLIVTLFYALHKQIAHHICMQVTKFKC